MQSVIQTRYDRLEKALTALLDTIISYNPSVHAADELVDADDSVNEALDQRTYHISLTKRLIAVSNLILDPVVQHHANYTRILSLRQTANSLDEQIKSTMRLLSETRRDLRSISSPDTHDTLRQVSADDLLSYAKFIAKTSVPPTFRKEIAASAIPQESQAAAAAAAAAAAGTAEPTTQITNGIATPAAGTAEVSDEKPETNVSKLNEETKAMLEPFSNLPFVPWPSQEKINAGALGHTQGMLEAGIDPAGVLSSEEQEAEDKRRKEQEEERQRVEEEERAKRRRESMLVIGTDRQGAQTDVFNPDDI